jgi:hypothetical protein
VMKFRVNLTPRFGCLVRVRPRSLRERPEGGALRQVLWYASFVLEEK